ncbi:MULTISPECIES: LysR substrate-binding domain-containing protein [Burkholderia]|uniref:LysR substrate-binding domain-containing protein n=4 Tax=Burkholderiaceae TaxID=119060 RepID=UPI001CF4031E|nr:MULTISPECIES: LysR substrate-binding domain-containing protein [Burkholderia]MCA8050301.1 LysR family transcriptional regulator [Burkholderia arboris]
MLDLRARILAMGAYSVANVEDWNRSYHSLFIAKSDKINALCSEFVLNGMRNNLKGIDVFVAAVEASSFAQAAEKLHITRSAVGKSIARLEERLGVVLFQRTTRTQSLTDEGSLFYEHCLRAMDEIQAGEALLETGKWQMKGRLRVSLPTLFGHLCLAPILIELAKAHPDLDLDLSFSDRSVDLVEERFDLAVRIGTLPNSSGLVARPLGEHRMAFCASPAYLDHFGEPQTYEELEQHKALAYTRFGQVHRWPVIIDGQRVELQPAVRLLSDDLRALMDAALADLGVAWLPYWLVRDALRSGALRELLSERPGVIYPIQAVWPYTLHLPLKVRAAVDALLAHLPARLAAVEAQM